MRAAIAINRQQLEKLLIDIETRAYRTAYDQATKRQSAQLNVQMRFRTGNSVASVNLLEASMNEPRADELIYDLIRKLSLSLFEMPGIKNYFLG